ncbi:MAG: UDP-N-acetylmuramate dehydrogenase [Candidatus Latescibacterota bacterium]|nr:UDP-N-acetylmuramate dehydrogenase [Candidatus Latescibacterota bacterium]
MTVLDGKMTSLGAELKRTARGRVLEQEPLAKHTTFGVGGPADLFFLPENAEDLADSLLLIKAAEVPVLPIGGGTNMLVKDEGFRGVVIGLTEGMTKITINDGEGRTEAGTSTQVFSRRCQRDGMSGMEFGCGIPGTIGGAVRGNAGGWGGEIFDDLLWVRGIDLCSATDMTLEKDDIKHGYRKAEIPKDVLIIEAVFSLSEGDPEEIQTEMDRMLAERKASQPVWLRNAGCVFKNPKGSSAGLLIDRSGCKGMAAGNVEVSDVHANFMVTKGGITAAEVLKLIDRVRKQVHDREGVDLETEVRIVGEFGIENV